MKQEDLLALRSMIKQSIEKHQKPDVLELVDQKFSQGFLAGLNFVDEYLINPLLDIEDEEEKEVITYFTDSKTTGNLNISTHIDSKTNE
jgi:hypothetical protein